jgi:septal ring factor EnvC (AmiA/AmiB activator)
MNIKRLVCLVLVLALSPLAWAQSTEDAQTKALREQVEREVAARKAEADKLIAADIAKNPNGANAIAARKAAEEAKAVELAKQTVEEKAKADAEAAAKADADKAEADRKAAAAAWAAGAKERERVAAQQKAAVAKWRATGKPAPNIMIGHRANGSFTVMVDGKVSTFATEAEAKAFADEIRNKSDSGLAY